MKALVLAPFSTDGLSQLRQLLDVSYESWTDTRKLYDPQELGRRLTGESISVLLVEADFVFEELFELAPDLKLLGVCRGELDHVDLDSATEHGVLVVNAPGRNARAVAELTLGFILSLARRVPYLHDYVKSGRWQDPVEPYLSFQGSELEGSTLGLVGLGHAGRAVVRVARALGMEVLATDPYAGALGQRLDGALLTALDRLLERSQFLSLHAPRSEETVGLLGESQLGSMPTGAYLINTAFYEMVDEAALVKHLKSGHLAGAALDVHPAHPLPPTSPLLALDNVILTPHIGGATHQTVEHHSAMMVAAVRRYLAGQRPHNLANPQAWLRRGS